MIKNWLYFGRAFAIYKITKIKVSSFMAIVTGLIMRNKDTSVINDPKNEGIGGIIKSKIKINQEKKLEV